ncbi:MAG: histidine kinase [Ferruginibacter sp.]
MTIYQLIFSDKKNIRLKRHLTFWFIYCIYFYLQSLPPRTYDEFFLFKTYYIAWVNLLCFAPVFIAVTYFSIYYLLPKTIKKIKYFFFIAGFLLLYVAGTFINYFTAEIFLYYTGFYPNTFQHRIEMGNFNTRWGMIIATVALGIKLSKDWYLQQKENLDILKIKSRNEMQLQKFRIHPEFLLRSLDTIYIDMHSGFINASSMILNLSDVLSYSLYETDSELVLLEKEIAEVEHLIFLEQLNSECAIEIQMHIKGSLENKYIAPMAIVKLLDECITLLHDTETESVILYLHIIAATKRLFVDLTIINFKEKIPADDQWPLLVATAQNRFREYYTKPDYSIELVKEKSETRIKLNLLLADNPKAIKEISIINSTAVTYDTA